MFATFARDRSGPDEFSARKNLLQLVHLRWIAVGGQVATMLAATYWLDLALPLPAMATVLACQAALNLAVYLRLTSRHPVGQPELFVSLVFDVFALGAQLYLSGGATNPFAFLFLLQMTLGAVLLEAWAVWTLAGFTVATFAFLVGFHLPLEVPPTTGRSLFELHVQGMLVCFALIAVLLVTFVARIGRNLTERDARIAALRQQAAEEEHIVRMGLLASGAAHELGTPLATLDVILNDWRRVPKLARDSDLAGEIADMQAEVRRCKAIVTGVLMSAGEARGERPSATTVRAFLDDIVRDRRSARPASLIEFEDFFGDDLPIVSDPALKQIIGNIIDNAAEASPDWVAVRAGRDGETLLLTVHDHGPGFAPEMLERFGKPYSSSKGRPGGGLGLFLVVNVVRKLGGAVTAANRPSGGAEVALRLPLGPLALAAP